jgi:hypothetical protein
LSGNFPRTFATFNIDTYLNSLARAENNPSILNPNTGLTYPTGYSTQVLAPDLPISFNVGEKTVAAYFQGEFSGERWRGDIGLRLVHTKVSSSGHSVELVLYQSAARPELRLRYAA